MSETQQQWTPGEQKISQALELLKATFGYFSCEGTCPVCQAKLAIGGPWAGKITVHGKCGHGAEAVRGALGIDPDVLCDPDDVPKGIFPDLLPIKSPTEKRARYLLFFLQFPRCAGEEQEKEYRRIARLIVDKLGFDYDDF